MKKKAKIAAAAALLGFLLFPAASGAEAAWLKFSDGTFTVYISSSADMEKLYRNLRSPALPPLEKPAPGTSRKEKARLLAARIKAIFARVRELSKLDVTLTGREKIVVLRDTEQLAAVFRAIYRVPYRDGGYSFYSPSRRTIYITEHTFCARILAHEMTHLVNHLYYHGSLPLEKDEERAYKMEVNF